MPAIRAVPSTSPFFAFPESTSSSVTGAITTLPSATATRSVAAFAETSTIRASPFLSRWVSVFSAIALSGAFCSFRLLFACEQDSGRKRHVRLAHQAFAHKKSAHTSGVHALDIGVREDAAFADEEMALRHPGGKALGGGESRLKCAKIAVVNPDKLGTELQCAIELDLVVHFDERVHVPMHRCTVDFARRLIVHGGHNDQNAIGTERTAFGDLVSLEHKVLAQYWKGGGPAYSGEKFRRTLKRRLVGEHRKAGRAAGRVFAGERSGIEVGADQSA